MMGDCQNIVVEKNVVPSFALACLKADDSKSGGSSNRSLVDECAKAQMSLDYKYTRRLKMMMMVAKRKGQLLN